MSALTKITVYGGGDEHRFAEARAWPGTICLMICDGGDAVCVHVDRGQARTFAEGILELLDGKDD